MPLAGWLTTVAVGLLVGGVAGLVGIGGGAVMVPFLYFFLARPELSGTLLPAGEQAVVQQFFANQNNSPRQSPK